PGAQVETRAWVCVEERPPTRCVTARGGTGRDALRDDLHETRLDNTGKTVRAALQPATVIGVGKMLESSRSVSDRSHRMLALRYRSTRCCNARKSQDPRDRMLLLDRIAVRDRRNQHGREQLAE